VKSDDHPRPQTGGSYVRDKKTGELKRREFTKHDAPAPKPGAPASPPPQPPATPAPADAKPAGSDIATKAKA
jgi:hypothetical protein